MKTGKIYEADKSAYYPYQKPQPEGTASVPQLSPEALSRHGNSNIYNKDKTPYYSPAIQDYRIAVNMPKDNLVVPVVMGDLTQTHADPNNLRKLQEKLDNLTPGAKTGLRKVNSAPEGELYYDSTKDAKEMEKLNLINSINQMQNNLKKPNMPELKYGKVKSEPRVQNYVNSNKEEENEYIARSYHYPITKDKKGNNVAGPVGDQKPVIAPTGPSVVPGGRDSTIKQMIEDENYIYNEGDVSNLPDPKMITPPQGVVIGTPLEKRTGDSANKTKDAKKDDKKKEDGKVEAEETKSVTTEAEDITKNTEAKKGKEKKDDKKKEDDKKDDKKKEDDKKNDEKKEDEKKNETGGTASARKTVAKKDDSKPVTKKINKKQ
jgi:hypothetical protein